MYPGEIPQQSHLEHGDFSRSRLKITAQTKQTVTFGLSIPDEKTLLKNALNTVFSKKSLPPSTSQQV